MNLIYLSSIIASSLNKATEEQWYHAMIGVRLQLPIRTSAIIGIVSAGKDRQDQPCGL